MTNLEFIQEIERRMLRHLDNAQLEALHESLASALAPFSLAPKGTAEEPTPAKDGTALLEDFLAAKRVEGCSERTLGYYRATLGAFLAEAGGDILRTTTDDLRAYLARRQDGGRCGKVSIDNIRRILSSFFSWLEDENWIFKSPVRRIHKIRTAKTVKETYSDESLESMRDGCGCARDLAIIDLLASTGMRVGELVRLDRDDVDFENRQCIVHGKGDKERPAYFDARTKIHLRAYLDARTDDDPALFVSLAEPHRRLGISGVEIRLRALGRRLDIPKVHPHKFRRTLATRAIDKGMPVEQVQKLLGHTKIDTTMQYAMVDVANVRASHRRYIA